jgi:HEAT repeat protein
MEESARDAIPILQELMRGKEASTRVEAANALCWIDVRSRNTYVQPIIAGLSDPSAAVRGRAAFFISQLGGDAVEAIPALLKTLKDEDVDVRLVSCHALGAMRGKSAVAIPALTVVSEKDMDETVRKAARDAIGMIPRKP